MHADGDGTRPAPTIVTTGVATAIFTNTGAALYMTTSTISITANTFSTHSFVLIPPLVYYYMRTHRSASVQVPVPPFI